MFDFSEFWSTQTARVLFILICLEIPRISSFLTVCFTTVCTDKLILGVYYCVYSVKLCVIIIDKRNAIMRFVCY